MASFLTPIIIAIISSNALFNYIQFMINRKDNISKKIEFIDQGLIRLQLLVLMRDYPDRTEEIMKLAKQYFCDFHGNYYLTSLFEKYIKDNNLITPQWYINKTK